MVGRVSTLSTVGPHCHFNTGMERYETSSTGFVCMKCAHAINVTFDDLCFFELPPECGKPKDKLSQRFTGYTPSHRMMSNDPQSWLVNGMVIQ